MTLLVIGRTGQLARHLAEVLPDATFWSRADANLEDPAALEPKVRAAAPSCIVNAAAYTAVDRAESDRVAAWRVNAESPAALARMANELDIPLVQVSTDYVFSGGKQGSYVEGDPVAPLNVYGATKLGGELAVAAIAKRYWILRVSWIFSEHGTNFVKTMIRVAKERDELNVVADQRGRPTYAGDLAKLIAGIVQPRSEPRIPYGTYHASGGRGVSWYEFATRIMARGVDMGLLAKSPTVHAIPTSDYPTPAQRPAYGVLATSRFESTFGFALPHWRESLAECMASPAETSLKQ